MSEQILEVEMTINEARERVDRGKMAERLALVPEFKKLILEGYFRDEASRLVLLLSDPMLDETTRNHVLRDMTGIGGLQRYLRTLVQLGRIAEQEIRDAQDTLDDLRSEEAESDEIG